MLDVRRSALLPLLALLLLVIPSWAQVSQSRYLYTAPDPAAAGGIAGKIAVPVAPLVAVLATPSDDPARVYRGGVHVEEGRSFRFTGLPVGKYDLVVVFADAVYEGLTLNRGDVTTLTPTDRQSMEKILVGTEPFYNRKVIHRLEGLTGTMTGRARGFCTFVRTKSALGFIDGVRYPEHRRSFKLVLFEDVGPGWQVAKTRELFVIQVPPNGSQDEVRHVYRRVLGGIRVTDAVKELGELNLSAETPQPER